MWMGELCGTRERLGPWHEVECLVSTRDALEKEERRWICGQLGLWEVRAEVNGHGAGTLFASWPTWGTDGRRELGGECPVLKLSWAVKELEGDDEAEVRNGPLGHTKPVEKRQPREERT